MDLFKTLDPDFGEDYSDEDVSAESSEDEIDIILHGTPEQKRKLYRKTQNKRENSSSEDDFESEMNKELQETIVALENKRLSSNEDESQISGEQPKENESSNKSDIQQFYDDIYFDSDEDEDKEGTSSKSKKKSTHPIVSNDDLLYDPDMDDEDQKWVDKQRKEYQPKSSNNKTKLPKTDAILNCPACMTTLCRDCQRHDTYANQYRAMFVINCDINHSETLKYPKEQAKKRKRKKKKGSETESRSEADDELYNPVKCSECQTVVAVYDKDEIYYFFNVLSSYS